MEMSPGKSRRISSNPSVRDEDVAARYQEMFPSDGTHAKRTTTVDEIKLQQGPFRIPASCHADAGHSVVGSSAGISTGEFSESLEAGFPSERARHFVREPIKTSNPELGENLTPEPVDGFIPPTLENFPTEPLGSVSPVAREILVAVFVFLFAVIGFTVGLTVGRGPLGRTLRDTQKSVLVVDDTSPVLPNLAGEATSSTYIPAGGRYPRYACSNSARIAPRKHIRSIPQCTTSRFSYPAETDWSIFSSYEPIPH